VFDKGPLIIICDGFRVCCWIWQGVMLTDLEASLRLSLDSCYRLPLGICTSCSGQEVRDSWKGCYLYGALRCY